MFDLQRPSQHGSSVRREIVAGLTTFLTMSYIIVVQPSVLAPDDGSTGLESGAVMLATCLSAALGSALMGLYARYPIALAPGMGQNFFFVGVIAALTSHGGFAEPWKVALGIVFVSGMLFLVLSLVGLRSAILAAVSPGMRHAIAVGIGLFIAFIGLQKGGVIIADTGTMVTFNQTNGDGADRVVFWIGLIVGATLYVRRVQGSILWGIVVAAVVAAGLGKIAWPDELFGFPQFEHGAIFQMDLVPTLQAFCLPYIFIFLFMDLFDTTGTLIGVADRAGLLEDGELPRARQAFTADAAATVAGACLGTSTVTSFIESIAGVEQGGRTGWTSVTVAVLFLVALVFSPLVELAGRYPPITASALVLVGALMMSAVTKIDWSDFSEALPALLTVLGIPLCYSIANGILLGLIAYPTVKLLGGRYRDVNVGMVVLAAVLMAYEFWMYARG